jgi:hypothetical protein
MSCSLFVRCTVAIAIRPVARALVVAAALVGVAAGARSIRKLISCSGRAVVVAQQPAQPLAAAHVRGSKRAGLRRDQLVAQPLMISLPMVVRRELVEGGAAAVSRGRSGCRDTPRGSSARTVPRGPSRKQSTPGDRVDVTQIRITHPFHSLQGQVFRLVIAKQLWGRIASTFERPDGSFHSVPVGWTDFVPADPYLSVGRGRSYFLLEDLRALATLVGTPVTQ